MKSGPMKVINLISIQILSWTLLLGQNPDNIKEWRIYKNPFYELKYLNTWEVELNKPFEDFVAYLRPSAPGLPMRETVVMSTIPITDQPVYNLDSYQRIKEQEIQNQIFRAEILESRIIKIKGVSTHIIVYKGEKDGLRLKWKEWTWLKDQKLFHLVFTAQESTFDSFIRSVEVLQGSIKFK